MKPFVFFTAEQLRKLWDRHREPHGMDIEGFAESLNAILNEKGKRVISADYTADYDLHSYWCRCPTDGCKQTHEALLLGVREMEDE